MAGPTESPTRLLLNLLYVFKHNMAAYSLLLNVLGRVIMLYDNMPFIDPVWNQDA